MLLRLFDNGNEDEGECPVDGGEAVLVQRAGTPTVDAAHAAVLAVEREIDIGGSFGEF